jgi:CDP-diacylglycerol--glycerol-3-phosphate 3-phosphatidyltransferase
LKAIPNLVTLSRIVLLLPIMGLLGSTDESLLLPRIAFGIFLLASFSDLLDGWLARRLACTSNLGAFLDPLADKIMTNVLLVFMTCRHPDQMPLWVVLALLAREFAVQGFRSMAPCVGVVIKTDLLSKLKTFFQLFSLGSLIVGLGWPDLSVIAEPLTLISLALALISGYLSMVLIFYRNKDLWVRPPLVMQNR